MMPTIVTAYDTTTRDRWRYYHDAYQGGQHWHVPSATVLGTASLTAWRPVVNEGLRTGEWREDVVARLSSYLVPHPGESKTAFEARMRVAAYINVIAPICDAYTDAVTGPITRDLGSLGDALLSLDGQGQEWPELVEDVARWATVYGWCVVLLDRPAANPAANREQELALRVGLRATIVHPPAIAWLSVDRDGAVHEIAFVDAPYQLRDASRQVVSLWHYTRETWARYEVEIAADPQWDQVRANLSRPLESGPSPTPGEVPIAIAYFRRDTASAVPSGISLVADAADLARAAFNTLSSAQEIHAAAVPFLAIPEPAAGGALDPATRVQVGPTRALGYSSQTGAPGWIAPPSESTKELREHAAFLMAAALRTTGLEVAAGDSPADASGTALRIRSRDFDARCVRFAKGLRAFEERALGLAARILGRDPAVMLTYPKRFVLPDPGQDLARALLLVQGFGASLSTEALAETMRQALDAALSLTPERLAEIVEAARVMPPQPDPAPASRDVEDTEDSPDDEPEDMSNG